MDKGVKGLLMPVDSHTICYADRYNMVMMDIPHEKNSFRDYLHYRDATMACLMYCTARNQAPSDTLSFITACNEIVSRGNFHFSKQMTLKEIQSVTCKYSGYVSHL